MICCFKQKTAYEMRIRDWISDVCSSDLEGQKLENRLMRNEKMQIADASVNGSIASLTLRFEAGIGAVTRDREGNVIAGSMTDAVPTHDVWTFSRDIKSDDPNWKLSETDEAA